MKVFNLLFILIITCLIATPIYSQWISIENYSLPGSNPEVQLISSDETSSIIKVDLPGYMLNHFMYKDKSYYSIDIGEEAITTEVGLPEIPHIAKILAIPDYGSVSVEVIETGTKNIVSGFNIVPARNSWKEGNPETEYIENSDFYKNGNVYPSEIVSVDEPVIFRDFRLVRVSIFPIRYSLSKNEIEAFSSVTVKINYLPGNGANIKTTPQRKIASSFDKIYKTMIFNYDEVIRSRYGIEDETANDLMLCIMPDSYVNTFTAYKDWKILSGMEVVVKKFSEIGATSNTPDVIKNFIADAYHNWQKPPTHILLIGDAGVAPTKNYTSQYDGYTFVNEDYFVEIDGNDFFPEMIIGRFTNQNTSTLQILINKFIGYEKTPYVQDNTWFKKALVCSDSQYPSQRQTKRTTAQYMLEYGSFTAVDSMYDGYPCPGNVSTLINYINDGRSFLNYRGQGWDYGWWTSQNCFPFRTTNISSINNGRKLTFVTNIGCGTAMFNSSSGNCFGEQWLELGTATQPRGAIAFVGPTSNTHTTYNNKIDLGIYMGMFQEGLDSPGEALLRGKMNMYNIFGNTTAVAHHFKVYCILGDPSIHIWKKVPRPITIANPDTIYVGLNQIEVVVKDSVTGLQIPNARVTITGNSFFVTGKTNSLGSALITCSPVAEGTLTITVSGGAIIPKSTLIEVVTGTENITPSSAPLVTDIDGNNDGLVNPNEHCSITYTLKNWGTISSNNVSAVLSITDSTSKAEVQSVDPVLFGNIAPGDSVVGQPFIVYVKPDCPIGEIIPLKLSVSSETSSWEYFLNLTTHGCKLEYKDYTVDDEGNVLRNFRMDPGETVKLRVKLLNSGDDLAANVNAVLRSTDQYITILDSTGTFGTLLKDSSAVNEADYFEVKVDENCPTQYEAGFSILLWTENGLYPYSIEKNISLPIAMPSAFDATGPDAYGYYAYSNKDFLWHQAPQFNWVEINGIGTEIPKPVNKNDFTQTVALPFVFKYYGLNFNQVRISSDGWIAFGSGEETAFENQVLPFNDDINNMIAAYWDDLFTNTANAEAKLLYYYDQENHRFIVEWHKVPHFSEPDELETFEIILFDPVYYPTSTGDGEILIQYKDVEEPSSVTVGMENDSQDIGLLYLFNENYDITANELESEFAIRITTDIPTITFIDEDFKGNNLIPSDYSLEQNYPNPFNPQTRIRYSLPEAGFIAVRVYSVDGEMIKELVNTNKRAGNYEVVWDGTNNYGMKVSSGIYFYQLVTDKFIQTKKLVLLK